MKTNLEKKIAAGLLCVVGVSAAYLMFNKKPIYDNSSFESSEEYTVEKKGPCDDLYFDSKFKEFIFQMHASQPEYMYLVGKRSQCRGETTKK